MGLLDPVCSQSVCPYSDTERYPRHSVSRWAGVVTLPGLSAASRLLADENECQSGDDERREEERQEPLARASEGNDLTVGGVEGLGSA